MRALAATLAVSLWLMTAASADPPPGRCRGEGGYCGKSWTMPSVPRRAGGPGPIGNDRGVSGDEHDAIFALLSGHGALARTVREIPGGVQTTTTTPEPELVGTLRTHVRQMVRRLHQGRPVRMWAPVFRGVFAHAGEIAVSLKDVEGGIEVKETSRNPSVVALIRAHAAKVSTFVARGHAAARPPWAGGGRSRMMPDR